MCCTTLYFAFLFRSIMTTFKGRIDEFRAQLAKERKERSVNDTSKAHVYGLWSVMNVFFAQGHATPKWMNMFRHISVVDVYISWSFPWWSMKTYQTILWISQVNSSVLLWNSPSRHHNHYNVTCIHGANVMEMEFVYFMFHYTHTYIKPTYVRTQFPSYCTLLLCLQTTSMTSIYGSNWYKIQTNTIYQVHMQ